MLSMFPLKIILDYVDLSDQTREEAYGGIDRDDRKPKCESFLKANDDVESDCLQRFHLHRAS